MSAWSSATGKPQLSYADRLRHASKSSASSNHDSVSAAGASSSSAAIAPSSSHPTSATDASKHNASLNERPDISLTQPHTKQSAANTSTSAHAHTATSTEASTTAASHPSTSARTDAAPALNVWEARRKQIAEREAEKSRERQQAPAHHGNDSPSAKASIASAAPHGAAKPKHATASTATISSKKGAKPSSNPSAADKKSSKPTTQPVTANAASASSQPASSLTNTKNAPVSASSSSSAPSAAKATASQASLSLQPTQEQPSRDLTVQSASSTPSHPANTADKPSAEPKDTANDANNKEHRNRREPAKASPASEQGAGAAARASSASTSSSRQPAPAPMPMHDDIPGSPATVASAIEEVLKNGGLNGAQTEDDDAWLARIHLLNGGQNMPKFGGIGPNGALGLGGEEEAQAAKKAERAVAAAWGAGKSVWNKSQQQYAQDAASANKQSAAPAAEASASKPATSLEPREETERVNADTLSASSSTAVQVAGEAATTHVADASKPTPAKSTKASATASATKPDSAAGTSGKKAKDEAIKPSKAASHTKTPAASVPSFEDVDNWPSPLDAGKKPAVDRTKPITAAAASTDRDARDAAKGAAPAKAKSFYETLDELQLRLAPGAHPQSAGASAGARKGKQQWVSILPDITHAASGSAAKPARAAGEAKPGKGKQARKEGNKPATAGAQQGKGDKDAAGKGKAAKQRQGGEAPNSASAKGGAAKTAKAQAGKDAGAPQPAPATEEARARPQEAASGAAAVEEQPAVSAGAVAVQSESASKPAKPARSGARIANGAPAAPTLAALPNGVRPPRSGASSGTHTPAGTRGSPRASVSSPPTAYAAAPLFFPPAAAGAPVMGGSWLPYASFAPAVVYESTAQTGAPVPPGVQGQLLAQVEFYFSTRNLQGDFFLRQKMDAQGWVGVDTIAEFRRVHAVTSDVGVLLDALRASAVLDVDAAARRVRKRFGWQAWVLPEQQQQQQQVGQGEDEPALGVVAADGIAASPTIRP